jgi:hypothetical protein
LISERLLIIQLVFRSVVIFLDLAANSRRDISGVCFRALGKLEKRWIYGYEKKCFGCGHIFWQISWDRGRLARLRPSQSAAGPALPMDALETGMDLIAAISGRAQMLSI